jgi:hypothetical protein
MAEKAKMDDATIEKANARLDEARAARDRAVPRDQLRSRIERKVAAKEGSITKAREVENRCKEALQQATEGLDKATLQVAQRLSELEALQEELANADGDGEVSCQGEDESLEEEFRGDVEVVRLHRQLEEAKNKSRERQDSQSESGRPRAAKVAAPTGSQEAEQVAMDLDGLDFEGNDFNVEDLSALGIGEDSAGEGPAPKLAKLAHWFQTETRKRLRGKAHRETGGGLRATISKVGRK